ncbi:MULTISPECIES: restriction endonuclease subunit S [Bacillus cereus group]|uniref:restriction endonuclease subunit S n=1 Tax=Bacillus cereus group TaxID=86661 RepID=UPI0008939737|nr:MULTISPECIES: restriction endonuclease subunit S [Bacillus cereus group]OFC88137.1 hypothetical protein BTGOE3_08970 [Bacillus thuringiensis]PEQ67258.1 restriction endonuclease subunit S [Bacillus cereus]UWJ18840.1 Type I restriction-modification system, specificity subunit S [Bacillus cereus]HCX48020.1 restriction endonuclease subunit S [Bacillus sp. (in: firmicutes)]
MIKSRELTIPDDWKVKKISWLFNLIASGSTPPSNKDEYYNKDIAWLNTGDLTDNYVESPSKFISNRALQDFSTLKVYPKESLVMAMYGATIGKLGITTFETTTNQACCVFSQPNEIDMKFMFYWLMGNREGIIQMSQGGGQPNISQGIIKSIRLAVPNLETQKRIVNFIDEKFHEINSLILDKVRLIQLLEEKRQSTIAEAVTKGLNPNVKMKDSGVEWIGEIPEHWTIKKIKHISNLVGSGKTPKGGSEIYPESGVLFLRSMNVHYDGIRLKDIVHITPEIDEDMRSTRVKSKDVLLNITGASIGRSCIVPESLGKANVNQHVCIIRSNTKVVVPELLSKIMASNFIMQQILMSQNGSSREGLNFTQVKNLEFPLTRDLQEQIEIANHILVETNKINSLIGMIEEQIQKLKEYRQSLIYEAVTGKIDVRDFEVKA